MIFICAHTITLVLDFFLCFILVSDPLKQLADEERVGLLREAETSQETNSISIDVGVVFPAAVLCLSTMRLGGAVVNLASTGAFASSTFSRLFLQFSFPFTGFDKESRSADYRRASSSLIRTPNFQKTPPILIHLLTHFTHLSPSDLAHSTSSCFFHPPNNPDQHFLVGTLISPIG